MKSLESQIKKILLSQKKVFPSFTDKKLRESLVKAFDQNDSFEAFTEEELLCLKIQQKIDESPLGWHSVEIQEKTAEPQKEEQGFIGLPGRDGVDGKDGIDGRDGKDGVPGFSGKDGVDGKDGKDGLDGADGKDGIQGPPGETGLSGKDGKDGLPGQNGNDGKDGLDGPIGPIGPIGKDGKDGRDGEQGVPGKDGKDGKDGLDGQKGDPGERGQKGDVGEKGQRGEKGSDGRPGKDGADGKEGPQGIQGISGKDGKTGKDGKDGADGKEGAPGPEGKIGPIGPIPSHEWNGSSLRFQQEDGTWGKFVDFKKFLKIAASEEKTRKVEQFGGSGANLNEILKYIMKVGEQPLNTTKMNLNGFLIEYDAKGVAQISIDPVMLPVSRALIEEEFVVDANFVQMVTVGYPILVSRENVYMNGLLLRRGATKDYEITNDVEIHFNIGIEFSVGDIILVKYEKI